MMEIIAARQEYRHFVIAATGLVRRKDNPADKLGKFKDSRKQWNTPDNDNDHSEVMQWIKKSGAAMRNPLLLKGS